MNPAYPIHLDLTGRLCVVVGGGKVAARRIEALRRGGAKIRVVSPMCAAAIGRMEGIEIIKREFHPNDPTGALLVFACTNDREVNQAVATAARRLGALCNVADDASSCDFHVPATVRRGRITVSIGSAGAGPGLSAAIKRRIEEILGPEYGELAEQLAWARSQVMARVHDPRRRRTIFETLCTDCSLKLLEARDVEAWRSWFERIVKKVSG